MHIIIQTYQTQTSSRLLLFLFLSLSLSLNEPFVVLMFLHVDWWYGIKHYKAEYHLPRQSHEPI